MVSGRSGTRRLTIAIIGLSTLAVALIGLLVWSRAGGRGAGGAVGEAVLPKIGGPFTLTGGDGKPVSTEAWRGRYAVIYFGYTFCPDACPTALSDLAAVLHDLGPDADKVQPVFITVDPERDTPEKTGEYVRAFDPRIIGLSGTVEEISKVAKAYRVYFRKDKAAADGSYLVDHSSLFYVIGPSGQFAGILPANGKVEELEAALNRILSGSG